MKILSRQFLTNMLNNLTTM